ncbi:MAG TPA: glycosyltransferase family 2 protein [Verrucomicrobiae bacterium]|jgi:glycosyltransferase involved in cell wall biosynthesis|nr:glycosyltransferase family 2 protein [Verrucomicrobiae bacterium]
MKRPAKASVIIPFFESGFLGETLEGLARQTSTDFEVVLVADGSPADEVKKAARVLAGAFKDPARRKLLAYDQNRGPGYARNYGIQFGASGKFIVAHDSDDLSLPRRVELLVRKLEQGRDLVYSDFREGVSLEDSAVLHAMAPEQITEDHWLMRKGWFGICHGTCAYRRDLALMYPYPSYARGFGEDTLFLIQMGLFAKPRMAYVPEPLLFYRRRQNSLSHSAAAVSTLEERLRKASDFFGYYHGLTRAAAEKP